MYSRPRRLCYVTPDIPSQTAGPFMPQLARRNCWSGPLCLGLLYLAVLAGCQTWANHRPTFWPFPERKLTTYNTPSMRVDAVQEFAMRSTGVDSPEQRQITDQLPGKSRSNPIRWCGKRWFVRSPSSVRRWRSRCFEAGLGG